MARVTVEDCAKVVKNRFELVMVASQRARDISSGAKLTIERDDDKNPVVALREVAEQTVDVNVLNAMLVESLQKHNIIERSPLDSSPKNAAEALAEEDAEILEDMEEASQLAMPLEEDVEGFSYGDENLEIDD